MGRVRLMDRLAHNGVHPSIRRRVKLSLDALGSALVSADPHATPKAEPAGPALTKEVLLALTQSIVNGRSVDLSSPARDRPKADRSRSPASNEIVGSGRAGSAGAAPRASSSSIPVVHALSGRADGAATSYDAAAQQAYRLARQLGLPDIRTEAARLGNRSSLPTIILRGSGGEGLAQVTLGGAPTEVFDAIERTLRKEVLRWRTQMVSSEDYDSPNLKVGDRVGHKWNWPGSPADLEVIDIRGTVGRKAAKIRRGGHYEVFPVYALYKAQL